MSVGDTLEALRGQREYTRQQYNNAQGRMNAINAKILRLKSAKTELESAKDRFKDFKEKDRKLFDTGGKWRGRSKSLFALKGNRIHIENERFYVKQLDRLLDSVNDEITRLENERNNLYGILGRLASGLNSLANEIENFFN